MKVQFWGVRGSVAWATQASMGCGCNTPCVALSRDDGAGLILDAGSGIVGLGRTLTARQPPVPVLLTHYHWDHVQGLPYFGPLLGVGAAQAIYAPAFDDVDPRRLERLFEPPFFPTIGGDLVAHPVVRLIRAGAHSIGGFEIVAQPLNHPGGAFAYRIQGAQGALVYATDHELGNAEIDRALSTLVAGARVLILDAHYTPVESPAFKGWGHSNWRDAAAFAAANGVGRLWLFHHKPGRTDAELREIRDVARQTFPATEIAAEGVAFDV